MKSFRRGWKIVAMVSIIFGFFGLFNLSNLQAQGQQDASLNEQDALSIQDLNNQIKEKQKDIEELDGKIKSFEESIEKKRTEQVTLEGEISVIGDQISRTEADVEQTELKIDELEMNIEKLNGEIDTKENELDDQKAELAELLRLTYRRNRKTFLEITLTEDTYSSFLSELKSLENLRFSFHDTLDRIEILKTSLEEQRQSTVSKKEEVEKKKGELKAKQETLENQKYYKNNLLLDAQASEGDFQELVRQMQTEQQTANADIQSLEEQVRQRLESQSVEDQFLNDDASVLSWPSSSRRITAYFHDVNYPFRNFFEHPAIDIGMPGGSPIRAAASGYVAVARQKDWITNANGKILYPAYNYVSIIHGDDISTVYGHLSEILVSQDEFVQRGQQIGESGHAPGTKGVGTLYTGPHLHFETRVKGIPVDPLGYLPN